MSDNPSGHYWSECEICGEMVICAKCGNNCCNGGHGTLPDGSECDLCPSAYLYQSLGPPNGWREEQ